MYNWHYKNSKRHPNGLKMTACYQVISQMISMMSLLYSMSLAIKGGGTDTGFNVSLLSVKKKKTRVMLTVGCGSMGGDDRVGIKGNLYPLCAFAYTAFILFEWNIGLFSTSV